MSTKIRLILVIVALVAGQLACDGGDITPNDVRDAVSEVYDGSGLSAQCQPENIWGQTEGQCH